MICSGRRSIGGAWCVGYNTVVGQPVFYTKCQKFRTATQLCSEGLLLLLWWLVFSLPRRYTGGTGQLKSNEIPLLSSTAGFCALLRQAGWTCGRCSSYFARAGGV